MVNILSGSVSAYRQESANQRFIRIDEVMDLINVTRDEAMDIALAAGWSTVVHGISWSANLFLR